MPAESCDQLRYAYHEADQGGKKAKWAKELIEETPDDFKRR